MPLTAVSRVMRHSVDEGGSCTAGSPRADYMFHLFM
jgi:hypothetical protein